jgi:hypothetical protein
VEVGGESRADDADSEGCHRPPILR